MPEGTSRAKIDRVAFYGGESHLVPAAGIYTESQRLERELGGHYMDQFTYAERATDWRGNNNIAESLFSQLGHEPSPHPHWVVVSAGTGGTAATIGRYIRYQGQAGDPTRLCVVDPENSVFSRFYREGDPDLRIGTSSRIEGIGRPRVEPSFLPTVVDRMIDVPDEASMAALQMLEKWLGRRCGGSTGTNLIGAMQLLSEMRRNGQQGSVATLLCDDGTRYGDTYFNDDWLAGEGLRPDRWQTCLQRWWDEGIWAPPE